MRFFTVFMCHLHFLFPSKIHVFSAIVKNILHCSKLYFHLPTCTCMLLLSVYIQYTDNLLVFRYSLHVHVPFSLTTWIKLCKNRLIVLRYLIMSILFDRYLYNLNIFFLAMKLINYTNI